MKKVISENPKNITSIEDVNSEKYYGFESFPGNRGFVTMTGYKQGMFITRSLEGITHGNGWSLEYAELKSLITEINNRQWMVFEFETVKELFTWLLETAI